ncbi:hypothetical protein V6Z11_D11G134000 [Gossypium hirsutum]
MEETSDGERRPTTGMASAGGVLRNERLFIVVAAHRGEAQNSALLGVPTFGSLHDIAYGLVGI